MTKRPDYYDMMKRPTDGATWDRLKERYGKFETQSTFKKPYQDDEYPEMEFFYPTPSMPYLPYPSWPFGEEEYPDYASTPCGPCVIACRAYGIQYECDETNAYGQCYAAYSCFIGGESLGYAYLHWKVKGDPILRIEHYKDVLCHELVRSGGHCIKIIPDWANIETIDDRKSAKYTVILFDQWDEEKGTYGNRCTQEIEIDCKEECCPAETALSYDATNVDTIVRETTETLTITGGCAPYIWSVAGTGFSLAYSNTEDRQNDLIADDTACGTAMITITDDCGTSITGYVRCTTGGWTEKSTGVCEMSGVGTLIDTNPNKYELISDYRKQLQTRTHTGGCTRSGQTCPQAIAEGICPAYCNNLGNCDNCIDPTDVYCYVCEYTGGDAVFDCYSATNLAYYEWECV